MIAAILGLMACSGDGADSESSTAGGPWPEAATVEAVAAFVGSDEHRGQGWVAETDAPRPENSGVSPHGRVQVWLNAPLAEHLRTVGDGAYPDGSVAVKELYSETDERLGHAVMWLDGDDWVYFCDETPGRCGDEMPTTPMLGRGLDTGCGFCHGGVIFNELNR